LLRIERKSKGFTLIELLIVVAIIGILAAVAIPAYSGYTKKSKVSGVVHAMGGIKNAVIAYYSESMGIIVAADVPTIKNVYGLDVSPQYADYRVDTTGPTQATVTATLNAASGNDTKTLTLTTTDMKSWSWGGTIDTQYVPKG
jgi:type IV pilus assembly protein PilA